MAGILDDLAQAVGTVASNVVAPAAAQTVAASVPSPPIEDRLAAVEQFVVTWGPVIEKLAPLLTKLDAL